MSNQSDVEQAIEEAIARHCDADVPRSLLENIRYSLHSPQRRIRSRLLLACAEMTGLKKDAALPAAVALEIIYCSTQIRKGTKSKEVRKTPEELAALTGEALISLGFEVFTDAAAHVKQENFIQALRRFATMIGPSGVMGGEAEEIGLTTESSLDELRKMQAKKTGSFFTLATLLPKDLLGISDDSSEGLALDIFGKEIGLAFQVLGDLEQKTTNPSPNNIRFYLQEQEVRNMTLQRLNSSTLSLDSTWGEKTRPVILIAEEIRTKIQVEDSE